MWGESSCSEPRLPRFWIYTLLAPGAAPAATCIHQHTPSPRRARSGIPVVVTKKTSTARSMLLLVVIFPHVTRTMQGKWRNHYR